MNEDQKKELDKDAKQLQADLKNKQKEIIKRKKTIRFGGPTKVKPNKSVAPHTSFSKEKDDILRQQLGL